MSKRRKRNDLRISAVEAGVPAPPGAAVFARARRCLLLAARGEVASVVRMKLQSAGPALVEKVICKPAGARAARDGRRNQ